MRPQGSKREGTSEEVDARLDQMREGLVIAEHAADRAGIGRARPRAKASCSAGSPAPSIASWPPRASSPGSSVEQQVEPLLLGQADDDAEQRRVGARARGPAARCSATRLSARASMRSGAVGERASWASVAGFQTSSSMPLRMPSTTARAAAQQPVERHAEFGRHDLARVGRRDRGDAVGEAAGPL